MKKVTLPTLILLGIGLIITILFIIAISQFITIQEKRQQLNILEARSQELSAEIAAAEDTLEIVSSLEYQEFEARKHGYAYPNDKHYVANGSFSD